MDVQRGESREGGRQPSGQPECIETTIAFNAAASLLPSHREGRSAEGPGPEEGQHGDHHHEKARQKQNKRPEAAKEPPAARARLSPRRVLGKQTRSKAQAFPLGHGGRARAPPQGPHAPSASQRRG